MPGSIHFSGATLDRAVENARSCDDCEVGTADLTHGSGEWFDLCRRHYWELVVDSREAVEGGGEEERPVDDDRRTTVSSADRTALASFGVDVETGATSVTRTDLAGLDPADVATGVPDDPDAVRVLGLLAVLDPESVAGERAAVEACLPVAREWGDGAAGASRVLGSVATVDPAVARTLLSAAATGDVPHHVARAIQRAVGRDPDALRSLHADDGASLLVETIAEAGRAGATSGPLFLVALDLARDDPATFVDHVDAFRAALDHEWHHVAAAATTFDAAATLGRTAAVDPDAVDGFRERFRALGAVTDSSPQVELVVRAAGAVAFAHAPALAARESIGRDWIRTRLADVVDHVDLEDGEQVRAEAARALGRFADEDDREYLSWVTRGTAGDVAAAADRAAAGAFRVEWPEGPGQSDGDGGASDRESLPEDPPWEVPDEYDVAFAAFEALGATPGGEFDPAAEHWLADWTAPLARLSRPHELAVLELGVAVDLEGLALALPSADVTYHPEHLPFLAYEGGPAGRPAFCATDGVAVCPRVTDREAAGTTLRALADAVRELDPAVPADPAVRFVAVGDLLDGA